MFSAAAGCYQASPGTSYHDHAIFILYHPAIMFWAAAAPAAGGYKQQLFDDASTQVGRWQDLGAGCCTIIISVIITNIITIITINIICTNPSLGCGYDLFDACQKHQHLRCHPTVVVWMTTRKAWALRDIWSMTMQHKKYDNATWKVWRCNIIKYEP